MGTKYGCFIPDSYEQHCEMYVSFGVSNIIEAKWLSAAGLLVLTVIGAFLPVGLKSYSWKGLDSFIGYFSYMTAGVFLGAGMIHMLPDSIKKYEKAEHCSHHDCYPMVALFAGIGFILVWLVSNVDCTLPDKRQAIAVSVRAQTDPATVCRVDVSPTITYKSDTSCSKNGCAKSDCDECTVLLSNEDHEHSQQHHMI